MNCLLNTSTQFNQTELDIHLQKPPGQVFTIDEQCQIIYGQGAYYCGVRANFFSFESIETAADDSNFSKVAPIREWNSNFEDSVHPKLANISQLAS